MELTGIGNVCGIVNDLVNNNSYTLQPNNDDVNIDNLLAHQGMFKSQVPPTQKRLYDARIIKLNFNAYIATWAFPNVPAGIYVHSEVERG